MAGEEASKLLKLSQYLNYALDRISSQLNEDPKSIEEGLISYICKIIGKLIRHGGISASNLSESQVHNKFNNYLK